MDIGWTELILIGVAALIFIGPKDLPEMFRTLGRFTAKLRSMSREFSRAMEQAANDTGVKDVAKDIRNVASPGSLGLNAMKDSVAKFEKWDPLKTSKPPVTPVKQPLAVTVPAGNQAVATPPSLAPAVDPVAEVPAPVVEPAAAEAAPEKPAKKPRAPRKKAES
jgi:sec-independent protein translocase protein TatB